MPDTQPRLTPRGHLHMEAFCLMKYRSDDGTEEEMIWNSRDGVTPFVVSSRSGMEMTHVEWQNDHYCPHFTPRPGDRIFVDLTEKRAAEIAQHRVEQYWQHPQYPMSRMFRSRKQAIAAITKEIMEPSGQPDLIEVAL